MVDRMAGAVTAAPALDAWQGPISGEGLCRSGHDLVKRHVA
jgi:hypothetical protein